MGTGTGLSYLKPDQREALEGALLDGLAEIGTDPAKMGATGPASRD